MVRVCLYFTCHHFFAKFNISHDYSLATQLYYICQISCSLTAHATNVQIAPEHSKAAGVLRSTVTCYIEGSHLRLMMGKKMRTKTNILIVLTHS